MAGACMSDTITTLNAQDFSQYNLLLAGLLIDSVNGGASVGFLPPLSQEVALQYWGEVRAEIARGHKTVLILKVDHQQLVGAVQLAYTDKPNARHRAEVQKLLVHSNFRRQGYAQKLMLAAEETARQQGKTLLVLDTRQGDPSEKLYLKLDYQKAGQIPQYAESANGQLDTTVFFYKLMQVGYDNR